MKKSELKKIIKEELLKEAVGGSKNTYYRLPNDVIKNELFSFYKTVTNFYQWVTTDHNIDPEIFDEMIEDIQKLKKQCKKFEFGIPISKEYEPKRYPSREY